MKKNIIALAVASAIAAPVAMADAPTIYGQVNKSIDSVDRKDSAGNSVDGDGVEVASRSSRLGVKGSEDLGNGLTAVYKLEFGVSVGDGDAISNRNQYVGLAGGFGTILAGRHDTPTKISQPTDFFNWGYGDLRQSSVTVASSLKGGEIRIDNVIAYISPAFNGVTLAAAVIPSEGNKKNSVGATKDSGLADTYSAALMYGSKKDGLYLAAAMDSYGQQNYKVHSGSSATADIKNISATYTRLSAQYATGGLTVNAILGNTNIDDKDLGGANVDSETMVFGAAYTMGKLTPKFKYSVSKYKDESEAQTALGIAKLDKKTQVGVGLDYALGKKTKAYVEYVDTKNATAGTDNTDAKALSVGLLHKF
jgi:predicted porin